MTAICKLCYQPASFTFRTAQKEDKGLIGGDDMYMPLCRECHHRETRTNKYDAYQGDPTIISAKREGELIDKKLKKDKLKLVG